METSHRNRPSFVFQCTHLQSVAPVIDFLFGLVFGVSVLGLNLSFKLFAVAIDLSEFIVGELAPLLLGLAGELFPRSQFIAVLLRQMQPRSPEFDGLSRTALSPQAAVVARLALGSAGLPAPLDPFVSRASSATPLNALFRARAETIIGEHALQELALRAPHLKRSAAPHHLKR